MESETMLKVIQGFIVISYIINTFLAYRAKRTDAIPSNLNFLLLWLFVFIAPIIPDSSLATFTYISIIVLTITSSLTAFFYYKRNNRVEFWLFITLVVIFSLALILALAGVIPM